MGVHGLRLGLGLRWVVLGVVSEVQLVAGIKKT